MRYNNKLIIIGASGHGKVILDIALKMKAWEQIFFLDDNQEIKKAMGIEVVGRTGDYQEYLCDHDFFVAIGSNRIREHLHNRLTEEGAKIVTLIHPSAVIGEQVEIGSGTAVMAGAVINCCTKIGKGCIINTGATIDHDNIIGDYVHISPGAHTAGTVTIGTRTWLGIGAIVSNNISIAGDCIIGAGAVVISDIRDTGTYAGIPAKTIRKE